MDIDPQILIFVGSLTAIAMLAGLARWLGLGGKPTLKNEIDVRKATDEVESGFTPSHWSLSSKGESVLAADHAGRIMVIKRHGNQFAGRILTSASSVREEVDGLIVDSGESWFGKVRMTLTDASVWTDRINRL
ncbi:MAG: hypothetical protein ABJP70_04135 [Erythrobacter sp.]